MTEAPFGDEPKSEMSRSPRQMNRVRKFLKTAQRKATAELPSYEICFTKHTHRWTWTNNQPKVITEKKPWNDGSHQGFTYNKPIINSVLVNEN